MTKTRTMYMHTLDGEPSQFYKKSRTICFAYKRIKLVPSLKQIHAEQAISIESDRKRPRCPLRHDYFTVVVEYTP